MYEYIKYDHINDKNSLRERAMSLSVFLKAAFLQSCKCLIENRNFQNFPRRGMLHDFIYGQIRRKTVQCDVDRLPLWSRRGRQWAECNVQWTMKSLRKSSRQSCLGAYKNACFVCNEKYKSATQLREGF